MSSQSNIEITISLVDASLSDEELQEEVENLLPQLEKVDGVEQVNLVPVEEAPPNSKALGGYLLGTLKTLVDVARVKPLFDFLSGMVRSKTIETTVKKPDGTELTIKVSSREDFDFAYQKAQEFLKG
ncbi:hypothetical protein ACE1CI_22885 [Aerosakkonemataceae cyanobacterium BLCC-F50]|uniref:Sugar ABC transporter permease n=1 Tax=Floridaenema flaviceps BLCC-F50 TaxID=3153642 RepID=A0ABV4XVN4_9CYAN